MATAYDYLSQQLNNILLHYKAPGLMAVIIRNGGDYSVASLRGVRKMDMPATDPNNQIQDNDAFGLGSVSKPVSGYMLAYLAQQLGDAFNFNTRIVDVFSELEEPACRNHYNIGTDYLNATIAMMMTHTALFPWAPTNSMELDLGNAGLTYGIINNSYQAEYANYPSLMQRRYNYVIAAQQDPPVAKYTYNGGPIIPSSMAERITGKAYEQLMTENVFQPLGMTGAGLGRTATNATPDGPWEHAYDKTQKKFIPTPDKTLPVYNYNAHAPAGAVYFTYQDAIKFMTALFVNNGKTKTVVKDPMLSGILSLHANGCALSGWLAGGTGSNAVVTHDGDNGTSHCRMQVYYNRGEGYIICCNGSGGDGTLDANGNENSIGGEIINSVAAVIEKMLNHWTTNF